MVFGSIHMPSSSYRELIAHVDVVESASGRCNVFELARMSYHIRGRVAMLTTACPFLFGVLMDFTQKAMLAPAISNR